MASFQFRTPGSIISAPGGVGEIGADYALRSARRVLLITDQTLVELGIAGCVEEPLHIQVCQEVEHLRDQDGLVLHCAIQTGAG